MVPTGSSDGYTELVQQATGSTIFSADILVAAVNITNPPTRNNNKVVARAYDDNSESETWDPIDVVYVKVYDSTIVPARPHDDDAEAKKKS